MSGNENSWKNCNTEMMYIRMKMAPKTFCFYIFFKFSVSMLLIQSELKLVFQTMTICASFRLLNHLRLGLVQ